LILSIFFVLAYSGGAVILLE